MRLDDPHSVLWLQSQFLTFAPTLARCAQARGTEHQFRNKVEKRGLNTQRISPLGSWCKLPLHGRQVRVALVVHHLMTSSGQNTNGNFGASSAPLVRRVRVGAIALICLRWFGARRPVEAAFTFFLTFFMIGQLPAVRCVPPRCWIARGSGALYQPPRKWRR